MNKERKMLFGNFDDIDFEAVKNIKYWKEYNLPED
jgi:hypothetical protein